MVAESMFVAASVAGGSRLYERVMAQYGAVLDGILDGEEGVRVFARQSGHSLSPGLQVADAAAGRQAGAVPVQGWGRFEGGASGSHPGAEGGWGDASGA